MCASAHTDWRSRQIRRAMASYQAGFVAFATWIRTRSRTRIRIRIGIGIGIGIRVMVISTSFSAAEPPALLFAVALLPLFFCGCFVQSSAFLGFLFLVVARYYISVSSSVL